MHYSFWLWEIFFLIFVFGFFLAVISHEEGWGFAPPTSFRHHGASLCAEGHEGAPLQEAREIFLVKDFMNQKFVARKDFLWKQYVIAVAPYVIDKLVDIYKQWGV